MEETEDPVRGASRPLYSLALTGALKLSHWQPRAEACRPFVTSSVSSSTQQGGGSSRFNVLGHVYQIGLVAQSLFASTKDHRSDGLGHNEACGSWAALHWKDQRHQEN